MTIIDYKCPPEAFVQSIDIHTLLPQQEPFIMVHRLDHFDEGVVVCSFTIKKENVFVDNNTFTASGLIENVAQTCAARIGYINKYILKKDIQIGFIGAVRNMDIVCLPKVGTDITTEIVVQEEVMGITLATATVTSQGIKLATAEIKIAIKEEWQQS